VIEEDVVPVRPQPGLAAQEGPDFVEGGTPRRADLAHRHLAAHRGQLAGVHHLEDDELLPGSSCLHQIRCKVIIIIEEEWIYK
jgi:hypothetical protein